MIKLQKITKPLILLLIITGFFSCNKDDNAKPFEVIGDVYVSKKTIDGKMRYANTYVAWGTQPMTLAKVITPQGQEITLSALSAMKNTYAEEPSTNDYSTTPPVDANYQFLVIHEDISHQAADILKFDDIDTTTISSVEVANQILSIQWETNSDAEAYVVRLTNTSEELTFVSPLLSRAQKRLDISPSNSGAWQETPVIGEDYTIELWGMKYEDITDSDNLSYHIQEISISQNEVVWQ